MGATGGHIFHGAALWTPVEPPHTDGLTNARGTKFIIIIIFYVEFFFYIFRKPTFSAVSERVFSKLCHMTYFIGNRSTVIRIFLKCPIKEIWGQKPNFCLDTVTASGFCVSFRNAKEFSTTEVQLLYKIQFVCVQTVYRARLTIMENRCH